MINNIVMINGKEAILTYRQSQSTHKEEAKLYTHKIYRVLEELLKGDRNKSYKKGITILNSFNNLEGAGWGDTRPSNAIVELRKVIPKSGLITFHYIGQLDRYALINDKEIIKFSDELLSKILEKL